MKILPVLALLCAVAACGGGAEPAPEGRSNAPAVDPREAERNELRQRIGAKRQELAAADEDLAKINRERGELAKQDSSQAKTDRLVELQRLESSTKEKRSSISDDLARMQAQLDGGPAPAAKPSNSGAALDDLLATNENKEKEDAERRKKKAEADASADKERLAQAEAARKAELDERAKQKVEGAAPTPQGAEGQIFEERWEKVITKVRNELQKYKRW